MGRVAGKEDTPDAHLGDIPTVNSKVAAPINLVCLDPTWCALTKYLLYQFQRRCVSFGALDCRYDSPPPAAHRENGEGAEFTGTELQLVCRKKFVRLDVRQLNREPVSSAWQAGASPTTELNVVEREMIAKALANCKGNKSKVAAQLGISRMKLYVRLRKYQLS